MKLTDLEVQEKHEEFIENELENEILDKAVTKIRFEILRKFLEYLENRFKN